VWNVLVEWIFSWTAILVLVPVFIALGWGGMSMMPPACLIARVVFTIVAILLLGKIGLWAISTEPVIWKRIMNVFLFFGIIGSLWTETMYWIKERELLQLSGALFPDNKPTPPNPCRNIPSDALVLLLGNSTAYNNSFPHTVITVGGETNSNYKQNTAILFNISTILYYNIS